MAVINADYLNELQANPQQSVKVIIRTKDDPTAKTARVETFGLAVTGTYKLISAIAATGPASAVLTLASESWVESIEPDQDVRTMG